MFEFIGIFDGVYEGTPWKKLHCVETTDKGFKCSVLKCEYGLVLPVGIKRGDKLVLTFGRFDKVTGVEIIK